MDEAQPKVSSTVDFSAAGKHHGYLRVPHSRNDSGWGAVHVPVTSLRNGSGPTVLLVGGNHGDEYEGPIALMKLARTLQAERVAGQVIIVPALNYPAVMAGTRVSPIDDVNMNRAFPGKRNGSVSSMIAHFVHRKILPLTDAVLDIHSGGKTMAFSPFACYHKLPDSSLMQRAKEAVQAFNAPIGLELVELDAHGMLDTTVEEMGKVFVSCEIGGGGTTTTSSVSIAETGAKNLLAFFGVIDEQPTGRELRPTRMMHMPDSDCYVICEDSGIYEALVDLNSAVEAGDAVGQVHFPEQPARATVVYRAARPGTVIGRSHKALVCPGDFLALIATDM